MRRACGYLGCDGRATHQVKPQYDPTVYRCATHYPLTLETYQKFDNRQTVGSAGSVLARKEPI